MSFILPHPVTIEWLKVVCLILRYAVYDRRLLSQKTFEKFDMITRQLSKTVSQENGERSVMNCTSPNLLSLLISGYLK